MKTNTPMGADFNVMYEGEAFVLIEDLDLGNKSVTNDAEAVVKTLLEIFPEKRIFYIDSSKSIDELCHDGSSFLNFNFGIPSEFLEESGL